MGAHRAPLAPVLKPNARPRVHPLREILDAVFYIVRSGCAWWLLPHDFAPWKTVYHYFRLWRIDGTWERMYAALRERTRVWLGRRRVAGTPRVGAVTSHIRRVLGLLLTPDDEAGHGQLGHLIRVFAGLLGALAKASSRRSCP